MNSVINSFFLFFSLFLHYHDLNASYYFSLITFS